MTRRKRELKFKPIGEEEIKQRLYDNFHEEYKENERAIRLMKEQK